MRTIYFKKLIVELAGIPLYHLSKTVKKDENIWVLGEWHGQRYSDNSRYLYTYISKKHPEITAVWLTKNKTIFDGLQSKSDKVFLANSFWGYYYALKAKIHIITHDAGDTNPYLSGGSILVSLTHGTPLKKLGVDAQSKRMGAFTPIFDRFISPHLPSKRNAEIIFCANEIAATRFSSSSPNTPEVLAFGYPRWDGLTNNKTHPILQDNLKKFRTVISYMPTLRFNNLVQYDPFSLEGLDQFIKFLEANNILLIIRPHPVMQFKCESVVSDNVIFLRSETIPDVFDILKETDILITDYSSVMYDYAILNKPIILLSPDVEDYINKDVGMYGNYYEDALGPILNNWLEIKDYLKNNKQLHNSYDEVEIEVEEGLASQRITSFLKHYINKT